MIFVSLLSRALGLDIEIGDCFRYGIGGMLPDPNCAYIGQTGLTFVENDLRKFTIQAKSRATFEEDELWYRETRGPQSLGALYYGNAPVLLCSPVAFKLLIRMNDGKRFHVFPVAENGVTYQSGKTDSMEFIYVVGLLLLANRHFDPAGRDAGLSNPAFNPIRTRARSSGSVNLPTFEKGGTRRSKRIANYADDSDTGDSIKEQVDVDQDQQYDEPDVPIPSIFFLTEEEIDVAYRKHLAFAEEQRCALARERNRMAQVEVKYLVTEFHEK